MTDMKQDFITAVENGNVSKVRFALSNELLFDPRGETFGEMLQYAMKELPDLFEENQEAEYSVPSKEEWDKEFLFEVKNDLDFNFSKEKLAFYEVVVKEVGKDKILRIEQEEKSAKEDEEARAAENSQRKRKMASPVPITIATGGAILTIVGICAGKTILTIIGGAIFVGGVVLILNNNK